MKKENQSGLVEVKPKHGDFAQKLFTTEDIKEKSLKIFHGEEVNGRTLQTVDKNLETNYPEFYKRLIQILVNFKNSETLEKQEFLKKVPKEWRLFYLGVIPVYLNSGWIVSDQELISQSNVLVDYLYYPLKTKEAVRRVIQNNIPNYYETYSNIREKYFKDFSPQIIVRPEFLIVCTYEAYYE